MSKDSPIITRPENAGSVGAPRVCVCFLAISREARWRLVAAQRIAQLPEFMFQRCTGPFSFVLLELFRGLFFYTVNFIPYFRGVTV